MKATEKILADRVALLMSQAKAARVFADRAVKGQCDSFRLGRQSCLRGPFDKLDASKICDPCRGYWRAEMSARAFETALVFARQEAMEAGVVVIEKQRDQESAS